MKISTAPTCPGHKRNQDSLNENQAVCLMRTLIYFIFPLYFISVSLDAANQQVFTECILRAPLWAQRSGGISSCELLCFAMSDFLTTSSRIVQNANSQSCLELRASAHLGVDPAFRLYNSSSIVILGRGHVWEPLAARLAQEA